MRVAETAGESTNQAILAFSVDVLDDARDLAEQEDVKLFEDDVIYQLVESYDDHVTAIEEAQQEQILENITRPAKFRILQDHIFRQSDPAVVGVEVLSGELRRNATSSSGRTARRTASGLSSDPGRGRRRRSARAGDRVSVAIRARRSAANRGGRRTLDGTARETREDSRTGTVRRDSGRRTRSVDWISG